MSKSTAIIVKKKKKAISPSPSCYTILAKTCTYFTVIFIRTLHLTLGVSGDNKRNSCQDLFRLSAESLKLLLSKTNKEKCKLY